MFDIKKNLGWLLVLFFVGFFIYGFNLNNELFWDDDDWIINNPNAHSLSWQNVKTVFTTDILHGFGLNSNYYRPLLLLSFAFNWVLRGAGPFGYHLMSNLFHIANALLIFLLLSVCTTRRVVHDETVDNFSKRAAFIAALLWLVHPLNVEAVAYISGRGDPMSVFFILLALFLWTNAIEWRYGKTVDPVRGKTPSRSLSKTTAGSSADYALQADRTSNGVDVRHGVSYMTLSVVFMVLAVLSRETAILFPALAMVFYVSFMFDSRSDLLKFQGRTFLRTFFRSLKTAFVKTIPFWIVSGVYFLLRLTVLNFQNTLNFYSDANIYTENLSYRLFTFGHALVEYFKLIFVPLGLHMERDLPVHTSIFQWPVWLGALIVAVIVFVGFVFYKNSKIGNSLKIVPRSPAATGIPAPKPEGRDGGPGGLATEGLGKNWKIWFFGWSWFFIALAPVSGIIPINALMYEHWLYLPLIGFAVLLGYYLDKLFSRSQASVVGCWLLVVGLIIYVSFLGVLTIKRNIAWGNQISFYEDILKYNPNTIRIINNLGNAYAEKGDLNKATEMYERAIASPDGQAFAQPYYNLGNTYRDLGQNNRAIELYKKAIETDPFFIFAYRNIAVLYAEAGLINEAIVVLEELKLARPDLNVEEAIKYLRGL